MGDEYESMSVNNLKSLLQERGLPKSGLKVELIERLREHDKNNGNTSVVNDGGSNGVTAGSEAASANANSESNSANADPETLYDQNDQDASLDDSNQSYPQSIEAHDGGYQGNQNQSGSEDRDDPSVTNLIINYLPNSVTEDQLRAMFAPYGDIDSCKLMVDKLTGTSLGYGFVKYRKAESANRAIVELHGKPLENKTIKVSLARPPSAAQQANTNVYIAGLPLTLPKEQLDTLFAPYGKIVDSKTLQSVGKGVAFVRFESRAQAEAAIHGVNGTSPAGCSQPLVVKFADTPEDKARRKNKSDVTGYGQSYGGYNYQQQYAGYNNYGGYGQQGYPSTGAAYGSYGGGQQGAGGAGGRQQQQGQHNPATCVFVFNLPSEAEENLLHQLFGRFGVITNVKIVRDPATQKCKGFGFVNFQTTDQAHSAVQSMNGFTYSGKPLQVSIKRDNNTQAGGYSNAATAAAQAQYAYAQYAQYGQQYGQGYSAYGQGYSQGYYGGGQTGASGTGTSAVSSKWQQDQNQSAQFI